ncbi:hypothetical protein Mal15_02000 [Stieleria maiorica]|uniref:Uncharacterized protein n=1 Tax=Stieleria maiorica TaxID=2795974 RepID=A0A5B9M6A5_9BACT|nr:hypothetical protein [Stieleria maiorica]QEF96173.1 hypothetical protein Mal15_02000 [Stieleria maiorica]
MMLNDQINFPPRPAGIRSLTLWVATCVVLAGLIPTTVMAAPIGLMERFALAEDREAILAELIPGSDDYFFYHCLHYQNTSQLDRAEVMLNQWLASRKGAMTALMHSMTDRQRLLTYDQTPQQTIDYFVKRLGIQLYHAPPAKKGSRRYPSELADNFIDSPQLVKDSLRDNVPLSPIGMQIAADWYLAGNANQTQVSLHDFLKRVDGSYLKGLDQLVIAELKSRSERDQRFGDLSAHRFLTQGELDNVGRSVPSVADDNAFVHAKLRMLRPDADVDISQQPDQRRDYLVRLESYVQTLPASYNSLKASAAYRLLESNLSAGVWDAELFQRYLQLPRQSPLISPLLARAGSRANLNEDFSQIAILPPIGSEQLLVETYLEHFLRDAKDTRAYERYLQPDFLRRVFARTKLMAGVANPQPFYDMLSAGERRELRDKIQLSFAPTNPIHYDSRQPTELIVDVKNIDKLVVRVYEMNSLAFHRTNEGRLDTDVELDGLIATHEKTIQYDRPAIERHRETIPIPEASDRGVWIVDLVGKGLRARTLIRRGDLQTVRAEDADGMQITVLDENRNPIPAAKVFLGNQEFAADQSGRVSLPMVNQAAARKAIVSDGKIAKAVKFQQQEENYSLAAGFFVDQTLLQSGRTATLLVRPRLQLGSTPVDPAILKEATLRIVATDLDGIETSKQFNGLELDQAKELQLSFRVPSRVAQIDFELSGHVVGLSDRRHRELRTSHSVQIAGIRRTTHTVDAFLTRNGDNYVIETRGRSGEAVAGATVQLEFAVDIGDVRPSRYLQSDDRGQIQLGRLAGVRQLQYGIAGQTQHRFDLSLDQQIWPAALHLSTEDDLRLPLVDGAAVDQFRLLGTRDGQNHADHSDQLRVENGFLVASKLPAGDLRLIDRRSGNETQLAVVDGQTIDHVLVGQIRHRQQSVAVPISIGDVNRNDDGSVTVSLAGNTNLARVHVVASRYFDRHSPLDDLHLGMPSLRGRQLSLGRCGYVSDLRLGDEYEYVLRRQYAAKYPGVMLPQPSVLLNPWETETTVNESQSARGGQAPTASAPLAADSMMRAAESEMSRQTGADAAPDYDFLSDSGVVAANLIPDADGRVTVPAELIDGMPIVQVIVADPATVLRRTLTAPLPDAETEDLRLADSLPLDQSLSFQRTVSIVSADDPLDLAQLGSAQVQVYGNVESLLTLYRTLVGDARLDEFQVLGRWHTLSTEEKLKHYSELACHELHLFLRMHDREFFDAVIKPYLINKKEKQFIDHWLLGDDLSDYATLWRYQRLSAAERALLALRVPALRSSIRRDLFESVALLEEDYGASRRLIESALRSSRMSVAGAAEFAEGAVEMEALAEPFGAADDGLYMDTAGGMGGYGGAAGKKLEMGDRANVARQLGRMQKAVPQRSSMFRGRALSLGGDFALYQELDSTKQWAESHFDRVRVVDGPLPINLIPINAFWNELAHSEWEDESSVPNVSKHLLECTNNRHSALIALAMCGLPLESGEISLPSKPETVYRPEHAVALVTKRLRSLKPQEDGAGVLIGQLFQRIDQDRRPDEPFHEPDQFVSGEAYQGQVVVSNPTATEKTVELFWQIPAGSIPLAGSQVTDSKTVKLAPFAVSSIDYKFYFPAPGEFLHYPATISQGETLLARGNEKTFRVAEEWNDDTVTWQSLARDGSAAEIKLFLDEANLHELDWTHVLHRMRDRDVYETVVGVMKDARLPEAAVWAYGFQHDDRDAMRRFLSLQRDLISRVGPSLESTLLSVDSIQQGAYEHLEYAPLVRARIHRLGEVDEILNPKFLNHYQQFVRRLGFQAEIADVEEMPLTYYLLLQNRIEEATKAFGTLDRERIASQLQYDYLAGYLALHQGDYERALEIAGRHESHPVPRWNDRFAQMALHVLQRYELMDSGQLVSAGPAKTIDDSGVSPKAADLAIADRDRANSQASAAVPEVIVRVEDDTIRIDHRNADQVDINLYGVDLELLFSNAPFARNDLQRIAMVRPTRADTLTMQSKTGTTRYPIPAELRSKTLLVEANVGASRNTTLYYGGELTTYVSDAFGQLQTTDASSHRPVAGAYVKVYARYGDGSVRFYKDGYTDGRGRFDYTSISAADAKGAQRYAILVLSDDKGATLHDVAAP